MSRLPRHRAMLDHADGRFGGDRREPHTAETAENRPHTAQTQHFYGWWATVAAPADLRT